MECGVRPADFASRPRHVRSSPNSDKKLPLATTYPTCRNDRIFGRYWGLSVRADHGINELM